MSAVLNHVGQPIGNVYEIGDPKTYGAVGDGDADDTDALNAAYAACAATHLPMFIRPGTYRYTSGIEWTSSVDVYGSNREFTKLLKDGDFDGILIDGAGAESRYQDFSLDAVNDPSGQGIIVPAATHMHMRRVLIRNQGSHGLELSGLSDTGFFSEFELAVIQCGGDGVRVSSANYRAIWSLDSIGNTGMGFRLAAGAAYHKGHLTVQQNVEGGALIAGQQNELAIYAEANTGTDITLTAFSVRNLIGIEHIDTEADFVDLGQNNQGPSISAAGATYFTPAIGRPRRTTNAVGLDLSINAGHAGDGADPFKGGNLRLFGGDAAGTGNENGGDIILTGGTKVGSGIDGDITLQEGTGQIKIGVPLVALGGGAAPILGTIGGSGPATAGQNAWVRFKDSTGAIFWMPAWK